MSSQIMRMVMLSLLALTVEGIWTEGQQQKTIVEKTSHHPSWRGYVINMEISKERMHAINHAWSAHPAFKKHFCRANAVNGRNVTLMQQYNAVLEVDALKDEKKAIVIACGLSHAEVWHRVMNDDRHDFAIVAEDDISEFAPNFDEEFSRLIQQLGKFGRVNLNHFDSGWQKRVAIGDEAPVLVNRFDKKHRKGVYHGSGMYMISREGARIAWEAVHSRPGKVDARLSTVVEPLMKKQGLGVWMYEPSLMEKGDLAKKSTIPGHGKSILEHQYFEIPDCTDYNYVDKVLEEME